MSVTRFYCPELSSPSSVLDEAESRHAIHSLRLRAGDVVELFDGRGNVARGSIDAAEGPVGRAKKAAGRAVTVRIEHMQAASAPVRTLRLIIAGCKGERLDWLTEKCTELGVTKLEFARFERSVVVPGEGHIRKLLRTAIEACKQCGRAWLPELAAGASLDGAIAAAKPPEPAVLLVAHPVAGAMPVNHVLAKAAAQGHQHVAAVIGPEGGLTDGELAMIERCGGATVRLGAHTLRVETAGVALAANWAALQ